VSAIRAMPKIEQIEIHFTTAELLVTRGEGRSQGENPLTFRAGSEAESCSTWISLEHAVADVAACKASGRKNRQNRNIHPQQPGI
jgi:hypothetical protein